MNVQALESDVWMFVGEAFASVATAFVDGRDVLLIDALGSEADADELHRVLCRQMGKRVRAIVATHWMSDHMAGLARFPQAWVIAQRHHRHAFLSQNRRVDAFHREPAVVFDNALRLRWGAHTLDLLHNPGKSMDHVSVDVPSADLVCVGDNIVGNIVYISKADPAQIHAAIMRVRQLGRRRVVGGHMGCFGAGVLDNALHYLEQLQETVVGLRLAVVAGQVDAAIAAIPIEQCLAPEVMPSAFEREWHLRNLEVIQAQAVFAFDAALAARRERA